MHSSSSSSREWRSQTPQHLRSSVQPEYDTSYYASSSSRGSSLVPSSYSTDQDIISRAQHPQLWLNPVYFALWQHNRQLEAEKKTIQDNYQTLANSIPQVFSFIPNPYGFAIPPPASTASATSLIPAQKPDGIRFWKASDWSKRPSKSGELVVEDTSDDGDNSDVDETAPKRKKRKRKHENVLGFLEHADGTPFDEAEIGSVRTTAGRVFQGLLNDALAPETWGGCTQPVMQRYRQEMIAQHSALALGFDCWKVDAVGTEVYSQWSRNRKAAISASKGAKKEEVEVVLEEPVKKAKKKVNPDGFVDKGKQKAGLVAPGKRKQSENDQNERPTKRRHHSVESTAEDPPPVPPPVNDTTMDELVPGPPLMNEAQANTPDDARNETLDEAPVVAPPIPPVSSVAASAKPKRTQKPPTYFRPEMLDMVNPLAQFQVAPSKPASVTASPTVIPGVKTKPPGQGASITTSTATLTSTNAVASSSKVQLPMPDDPAAKVATKPKGSTYFMPSEALTGYNLFGIELTNRGKTKMLRDVVRTEYEKPENKPKWDSIAKERKAAKKEEEKKAAAANKDGAAETL
ncbi:hypothetical protein MKEN_00613300 [Mycena kentingensis (nom. inval.)]|nr:hypothetical protein MKEN_00613300 [Mycena kentingensis (nom. inval.)]